MKSIFRPLKALPLLGALGSLALLTLLPEEAAAGAQQGLSICGGVILPSLLPFLTLSNLLTALGLPRLLARRCAPLLGRLGIPPQAAAPLLLGLTGGYPVGAAAVAELVRSGELSSDEAAHILPGCSNTGPAFIMGAAGAAVFGSGRIGLLLYVSHILAALCVLLLFGRCKGSDGLREQPAITTVGFSEAFPAAMRSAALSAVNICGYVVVFSVLTALLRALGWFPILVSALHDGSGMELQSANALLTGLLELGSGIAAMRGMPANAASVALCAFLLGFGGLSVYCQTLGVVSNAKIKCARQLVGRMVHGLLSALISFVLFRLLQI